MAKITKIWKHAGYLPGQYQKLTITFVSRDADAIKVKYKLYVKSLGTDNYDYGTRHNKFTIYFPSDTARKSRTYQAKGTHTSLSKSGEFTISGVGNNVGSLDFYYKNARIWVRHTNYSDPRSTGVVKKTKVGSLSVPKNTEYSITFDEVMNDKTYNYYRYAGDGFTVPNIAPKNHYFTFKGWSSINYAANYDDPEDMPINIVERINPTLFSGSKITVNSNVDYYAVWRPKYCTYKFYDYNKILINSLSISHKWGTSSLLPNLTTVLNGKYKVPGYDFMGWKSNISSKVYPPLFCDLWPPESSSATSINFYPQKKAQKNTVKFYLPSGVKSYTYYTDSSFNMSSPLTDTGKNNITLNPGYKLIGWMTIPPYKPPITISGLPPSGIALPGEGYKLKGLKATNNYYSGDGYRIYPISGNVVFNYSNFKNNVLQLYPYYEYYTTSYVYINGQWKLAMPYIYKDNTWKMALSYVYSNNTWKL